MFTTHNMLSIAIYRLSHNVQKVYDINYNQLLENTFYEFNPLKHSEYYMYYLLYQKICTVPTV
jgi:hypothetical protein